MLENPLVADQGERLVRVEAAVGSLQGQMATISAKLDAIASSQKTPWNTISSWALIALTIVGMGGGLLHYTLNQAIASAANTLNERLTTISQHVNTNEGAIERRMQSMDDLSSTRHESQAALLRELSERISLLRTDHDAFKASTIAGLQKVETQMHASSHYRNMQVGELKTWISAHHAHLVGRHIPWTDVYPVQGRDVSD